MRNRRQLTRILKIKERVDSIDELAGIDITPLLGRALIVLKDQSGYQIQSTRAIDFMVKTWRSARWGEIDIVTLESIDEIKEYLHSQKGESIKIEDHSEEGDS